MVYRTDGPDRFFAMRISRRGQPIADQMGLEIPFFKRHDACRGEMDVRIPRCMTSSAISRPEKSSNGTLFGLLARKGDQLAELLCGNLRRPPWSGGITESFTHREILQRDLLPPDESRMRQLRTVSTLAPISRAICPFL